MVTRRAECSCGQLSATCAGEPIRVSVCHCLACKRRTGSAFSFNARFAETDVSVQGRAAEFTRIGDEGGRITYSFCPDCGSTVCYRINAQPGVVAIPPAASPIWRSRRPPCPSITTAGAVRGSRSPPTPCGPTADERPG